MSRPLSRTARAAAVALVLCALAWLAPAGAATRSAGAHRASSTLLGGVYITGLSEYSPLAQADRDVARARSLNAKVVRIDIPWSVMEPRGPNQLDAHALAYTDRLMSDASARGIRVIMMVESTPCWASSSPTPVGRKCGSRQSAAVNRWPPNNPADYAAFVAYLAARYGTQLAAIEVWNEPDQANQQYFAGPEKARRYAAILRAAYPAIKQANPNVTVLGGSLVGSSGVFLRALYAAGIKGYYDGLSVHYYDLTLASLRAIHAVQLANGDPAPLWLDEFGWSSCWPRYKIQQEQACVTKQIQATNVANLIHALARVPYVAAAVVYKLQGARAEDFGVLSAAGSRKPAFAALASALASPLSSAGPVSLALRRAGASVVASGSGPPGDYVRLEAFQGSTLRYWAVFTLDRFNRYSITLPSLLGTRGLRIRVYELWAGAARAAQRNI